ncbi:DNA polymerase III subunit chi [Granulosicoccus sp. 3-233]|uniref:DNA polymerase III subunit chi n=1 Tax=Granulosicoccus sp. 3-233 TaxID=3417969 RepID=UPI003D337CD1
MTRIDFYVLAGDDPLARLHLVCKLAEKAIGVRQKVFIYSDSELQLEQLDACLWDFRAMSFIAHQRLAADHVASSSDNDPVHLSTGEPASDRNLLINLASDVPPFFSRFERTLEVVNEQAEVQSAGRLRYRFYQQRGYPLHHHKIQ